MKHQQALHFGQLLENLFEATKARAQEDVVRWCKTAAPSILSNILDKSLGFDADPPSQSIEMLAEALTTSLSKFCNLLGSTRDPHFEKYDKNISVLEVYWL